MFDKTVRLEQRAKFLKSLGKWGLETNRMEHNQLKSRRELTVDTGRRVRDLVEEINLKTKDAERAAEVARRERNEWKEKVEKNSGLEKNEKRNLLNKLGKNARRTRMAVKLKYEKAIEFKIKKWALENGNENDDAIEMFSDKELKGYKGLSVFNGRYGRVGYEDE